MNNNCIIREIVNEIKGCKLSFYCGAGISFNSGIPIVNQLLDYLFETLNLTNTEREALRDSDIPFESIMENLLSESELTEFQNIFLQGTPNTNHFFIAKLIKKGFVKIVYTTNFDLLIEKALVLEGLEFEKDFKVYRTENELRNINWNDTRVKIIKIHGCASAPKEMAITLSQLASNKYLDLRTDLLTHIFSSKVCSSALVIGYSCSDFDLLPIIASLKNPSSQIFYVEHNSSCTKIEPIHLKVEKNPFKKYKGKRLIQNTNLFIKSLSDEFLFKFRPIVDGSESYWKSNIHSWYLVNAELSGRGFKHHIAARLLYAIGENQSTITHAQKAIEIAFCDNNAIAYASELGTMGMAHNRLGNFNVALRCFEKALPITKEIGDEYNICVQLQAYANVLHQLGRNEDAIENFKQALEISQANGNKYTESNILGNLTNCHVALNEYLSARYCVFKALEISSSMGNKQAESSQLGLLAQIQMNTGHIREALKTMLSAIDIKIMLADNNELCKLYLNLTGLYILLNKIDDASSSAKMCLTLSKKIKNLHMERMILIVIAMNELRVS